MLSYFLIFLDIQPLSCLRKYIFILDFIYVHEIVCLFCYCLSIALTSIGHKQQRQFSRLNIIFNQSVQQSNILLSMRKRYVFINTLVKQYRIVSAELENCVSSENGQHSEVLEDITNVFVACSFFFSKVK